jgi:hypothetical protein
MKCNICEDSGWICDNHPHRPWEGNHACSCGGAPCPHCNGTNDRAAPRMPSGFRAVKLCQLGAMQVLATAAFKSKFSAKAGVGGKR